MKKKTSRTGPATENSSDAKKEQKEQRRTTTRRILADAGSIAVGILGAVEQVRAINATLKGKDLEESPGEDKNKKNTTLDLIEKAAIAVTFLSGSIANVASMEGEEDEEKKKKHQNATIGAVAMLATFYTIYKAREAHVDFNEEKEEEEKVSFGEFANQKVKEFVNAVANKIDGTSVDAEGNETQNEDIKLKGIRRMAASRIRRSMPEGTDLLDGVLGLLPENIRTYVDAARLVAEHFNENDNLLHRIEVILQVLKAINEGFEVKIVNDPERGPVVSLSKKGEETEEKDAEE